MLLNDRITVYEDVISRFDPDTNKHVEVKTGEKTYQCNVSIVKDYVNDISQGRITGKTLKVRFLQQVPKFNLAEYNDKTYKPSGYAGSRNKMSVTLEEVVN